MIVVGDYELLEPIASGQVESFFARHRLTHDQVVVHMFVAPEDCLGDAMLVQALSRLVPPPPGVVAASGRRPNTPYSYIVTSMPAMGALYAWVRDCEKASPSVAPPFQPVSSPAATPAQPSAHAKTYDVPFGEARLEPTIAAPPQQKPSDAPTGDFTAFFHKLGTAPKPAATPIDQFSASSPDFGAIPATPAVPAVPPVVSAEPQPAPPAESFTQLFNAAQVPRTPSAPSVEQPVVPERAAPGEFTSFFRNPLANPAPADEPLSFANLNTARPPVQQTGEFTRMFGRESIPVPSQPAPASTPADADLLESPGEPPSQPPLNYSPIAAPVRPIPPSDSVVPPAAPAQSTIPPAVAQPQPPAIPSRAPSDATSVFTPAAPAPDPLSAEPAGPSEYTRILSRGAFGIPPAPQRVEPPVVPPPSAPVIPPPAVTVTPPQVQPPVVAMPQMAPPQVTPPSPPPAPQFGISAPQAPAMAAPGKAASYWPLITVLIGLFAVAVILIMYFALKH